MTHEDIFKEFNYECLSEQVGGSHQKKNKAEDIKKAIHYLKIILERDYPDDKED